MICYEEALGLIKKYSMAFGEEDVDLRDATGKIAAQEYRARLTIPSHKTSAMDGFAFKYDAFPESMTMPIGGRVFAGDVTEFSAAHEAYEIMTGALLPDFADTVIPVEEVERVGEHNVRFQSKPKFGSHVRMPGEDFYEDSSGDRPLIVKKGQKITSEIIMALATHGIASVRVFRTPTVHIISTGNEIIDYHEHHLGRGKIYNSCGPYLLSRCASLGLKAHYHGIVSDDADEFSSIVRSIPPGSLVITTGAVSAGHLDFIPNALRKLGAEIHFHKVRIKPAKPILFASLSDLSNVDPNDKDKNTTSGITLFFGLPGNPVSVAVGFRFFIESLLASVSGTEREQPILAVATSAFTKKSGIQNFLKAFRRCETLKGGTSQLSVDILDGQESFKINSLLRANCWAVIDEDTTVINNGDLIPTFPL